MKAVGHVEINKYLETCGLGQFMLNDRDRLLWNLDVLVDLSIITTEPYEGLSGFRGNNQRRRYGRLTVDVKILVESIELFLSIFIECFSDRSCLW